MKVTRQGPGPRAHEVISVSPSRRKLSPSGSPGHFLVPRQQRNRNATESGRAGLPGSRPELEARGSAGVLRAVAPAVLHGGASKGLRGA